MNPIISVENLGKKYTLRHQRCGGAEYRRFSEELVETIKRPFRSLLRRQKASATAKRQRAETQSRSP